MESEEEVNAYDLKSRLHEAAEQFNPQNGGDTFLVAAQESLERKQAEVLLMELQVPENCTLLDFVGWDLFKMVFQFLPDDCVSLEDTENHKKLLYLMCNSCNPREICLSLDELLFDEFTWQKLVILLRLLILTCRRLEGKNSKILVSILASLRKCLRKRNDMVDQAEIMETTLEFVGVLVERIQHTDTSDAKTQFKEDLLSFLIALLEHPFVLLAFKTNSETEESSEQVNRNDKFAETVIQMLGVLENGCLKRLLDYGVHHGHKIQKRVKNDDCDEDNNDLSFIGLGCLAFLTHVAGIGEQFIPVVTTGKYSLDTNMVYMNTLLCNNEAKVVSKGLSLLLAVLGMIEDNTLDHSYIDNKELTQLLINLRNIMVHSDDNVVRQESVKAFRNVLGIFTRRGKYRLLRFLQQGQIQSGFAELLNLILKEEIANSFQYDSEDQWFLGSNLTSFLLDVIFKVPPTALQSEFGIIEESNRVLSALNLVRFLLIRDDENKTAIHRIFPQLQDTYLKELRDIIKFSRARITTLIKEKENEVKKGSGVSKKAPDDTMLNVTTIEGSKLEQGSPEEQLEVLQSACLTLDMIESILARLGEISADKRSRNM